MVEGQILLKYFLGAELAPDLIRSGSRGEYCRRAFVITPCPLGNRPHANPNGGSLVRNIKHLYFLGINIEDKEPLIDEARWFDDIEASGVAVQSLSTMQSTGASTTPWPYYFATFPL